MKIQLSRFKAFSVQGYRKTLENTLIIKKQMKSIYLDFKWFITFGAKNSLQTVFSFQPKVKLLEFNTFCSTKLKISSITISKSSSNANLLRLDLDFSQYNNTIIIKGFKDLGIEALINI